MERINGLFSQFFGTVGVVDSIRVTLIMSFWSTLIASSLGIVLGLLLEKKEFPGKRLVVRVNRTLMGAPPVVIGLLTYMLLRKNGLCPGADYHTHRLRNGIFLCDPHGAGDSRLCENHGR